jgi:hypothetical protein
VRVRCAKSVPLPIPRPVPEGKGFHCGYERLPAGLNCRLPVATCRKICRTQHRNVQPPSSTFFSHFPSASFASTTTLDGAFTLCDARPPQCLASASHTFGRAQPQFTLSDAHSLSTSQSQPLSLSLSDDISPPHLSPSCNLTLSDARATLCACKLSARCTVSFFLTSLCYKLTTPRTFTLVDSGARATPRRRLLTPHHRLLTPHPLGRTNHAPSLPCRRRIVADSTHHQHARTHAQRHKIRRHRLDARGHHTRTQADDAAHAHTGGRAQANDDVCAITAEGATRTHSRRRRVAFTRLKPSTCTRTGRRRRARTDGRASTGKRRRVRHHSRRGHARTHSRRRHVAFTRLKPSTRTGTRTGR